MSDIAISIKNIGKRYRVFDSQRSRLIHAVWPKYKKGMQEVWALKNISFEIKRGESVAIIGRNGAGKSTLLEILTGTLTPTTGDVKINGRVSALLELGSGFNPEYSGRDNVILNGLLLGLSKKAILSRFSEIEDFAEIGNAIDRPVKTYSSGMMVRLAFAVQVLCDPDILIIDEALSIGDFFFQQKCMSYIQKLCAKGVTLLFVSHDIGAVRDLCQVGVFLEKGSVKFFGHNATAINYYLCATEPAAPKNIMTVTSSKKGKVPEKTEGLHFPLWRNAQASPQSILEVGVYNVSGEAVTAVSIGEELVFKVRYCENEGPRSHVMFTLHNKNNQVVTSQGTYNTAQAPDNEKINDIEVQFSITCSLEAGEYSFIFTLSSNHSTNTGIILYETPRLGPIQIMWDYQKNVAPFFGLFGLPVVIKYNNS